MSLRNIALTGFWLMIAAFVFGFFETWYFGWNWHPESKAEFICDAVSATVCIVGCFILCYAFIRQTERDIKEKL